MKTHNELISWLIEKGVGNIKHSNRTLLYHLDKVYSLLKNLGYNEMQCNAGLFHSIYGTRSFSISTLKREERNILIDLISKEAEEYVWIFSKISRPVALKEYIDLGVLPFIADLNRDVQKEDMELIISIEAVNLYDQQCLWLNKYLIPHAKKIGLIDTDDWGIDRNSTYVNYVSSESNLSLDNIIKSSNVCTVTSSILD